METVVSGIRSTGNLHLGNYYGALRNFIEMQKTARCLFFIADYHSLTTHTDPVALGQNVRNVLSEYLGAGLDPELSTIFIQSDMPQVAELYLLLNMHASVGDLERTASFKEKIRGHEDNVNAGQLGHVALMAADQIAHRGDKVPVGKDQEQHLEMTRRYARRFNSTYGVEYFPEPEAYNFGAELVKVPGLDGSGKMGKSTGNGVYLVDSNDAIRKKVMRAVTDSGPTEPNQTPSEPIANIFQISISDRTVGIRRLEMLQSRGSRHKAHDLKKQLAEDMIAAVAPIRERILEIRADEEYLSKVARQGAEKARESASKTVREVREIMGIKHL